MDLKTKNTGCIWLNGPHRSGRDELARMLAAALNDRDVPVEYLDEETIDAQLAPNPPGTAENAGASLLRAAFTAHLLTRNGVTVVVSAAVQNQDLRQRLRDRLPHWVEVAIHPPTLQRWLEDPGPGDLVEPDIILNTDQETPDKEQLDEILARLLKFLEISGHIPTGKPEELTKEESALVKERLKALGYL